MATDGALLAAKYGEAALNPHHPKYRCCFLCCHVRLGVLCISAAELAAAAAALIISSTAFVNDAWRRSALAERQATSGQTQTQHHRPQPSSSSSIILQHPTFLLASLTASASIALLFAVSIGCMLYGVRRRKHAFIRPHLVAQLASICVLLTLIGWLIWSAVEANRTRRRNDWSWRHPDLPFYFGLLILALIAAVVALILQVYFFVVCRRCYRYVRKLAAYHRVASFAIAYSGGGDEIGPAVR